MLLAKSDHWNRGSEDTQISRVLGGISLSTSLDFSFLHYGPVNMSVFKGSPLALMLMLQRAV